MSFSCFVGDVFFTFGSIAYVAVVAPVVKGCFVSGDFFFRHVIRVVYVLWLVRIFGEVGAVFILQVFAKDGVSPRLARGRAVPNYYCAA